MVKVKFFAILKHLGGKEDAQFDIGSGIKLKDLVGMIDKEFPKVGEMIRSKRVLVSINHEIGSDDTQIKDGDEVGILPPFAGGGEGSSSMVRVQKEDFSIDEEINRVKASSGDIGGI